MQHDGASGAGNDLSTREGSSDLVVFLVVRFIVVLVAVIVLEMAVTWFEGWLLPGLAPFAEQQNAQESASPEAVVLRLLALFLALVRGDYLQAIGAVQNTLMAVLLLALLLLLVFPPLLGALVYARMVVRKVRALQDQREQELALIDQRRSQFITDIAHDLRTPLMAISGMAHALEDGVVHDDATRGEYVRAIEEKAEKMSGLVTSVFDYTKLGAAGFSLERARIDLPQLLLREAAAAYPDIEDAQMTFTVEVPEAPCSVYADPVQLGRVVSNLLVNAVHHNVAGTEIALALVRSAGVAYVVVADTGDPIEGDVSALFEPFSRGDAARSGSGSGLGLSICKRIADMHGYSLTLAQPYGRFSKAFALGCTVL